MTSHTDFVLNDFHTEDFEFTVDIFLRLERCQISNFQQICNICFSCDVKMRNIFYVKIQGVDEVLWVMYL